MTRLRHLWVLVLLGVVAGVALGHFAPALGAQMKPLGDAFIALLRMIIPPVIFLSITHGVAGIAPTLQRLLTDMIGRANFAAHDTAWP